MSTGLNTEVAIRCSYGSLIHRAGDLVSVLLHAGNVISAGEVHIQAYGHLFVDPKWLVQEKIECFTNKLSLVVHEKPSTPPRQKSANNLTPHCIYITPKTKIDPIALNEEGVLVQMQLPADVFPTFHGVACSISYSVAVYWEMGDLKSAVYFPLRVCGSGSCLPQQLIRWCIFM